MPSLKDIRTRIVSVKNTQKITKAMKMVAAAKLRRAQAAVVSTRPYAEKLTEVIEHLSERVDRESHPLLREPESPQRAVMLVVAGDRGLCGAFNTNVLKRALTVYEEKKSTYDAIDLILVGRRANEFFKRRQIPIRRFIEDAWTRPAHEVAQELADVISEEFGSEELDEFFATYTKFRSAIAQEVVVDRILPLRNVPDIGDDGAYKTLVDFIYEPSADDLLKVLLPRAVMTQIQRTFLESAASEHGARMTAMDNSTTNAGEMIDSLTLQYNRARQAAITRELIEIIGGAEAI